MNTSIRSRLAAACVLFFSFTPLLALAHAAGASWESKVGAYTIDVGYDPVTFVAGDYSRFDLNLWEGSTTTGKVADFEQVWVRLVKDKDTLLATGIMRQPFGPTTLLYEFSASGAYVLSASFRDKEGNDIATADFPISVTGVNVGVGSLLLHPFLTFLMGMGLGALGMYAALARKQNA